MKKTFAVIVLLLAMICCKKETDEFTIDYQVAYVPTATGHWVVYDVDSIRYNFIDPSTQQVDTIRYQQRETITDTFYDNLGRIAQRLELARRPNSSAAWVLDRVWYSVKTGTTYEKVENDLRFLKLVFPPYKDITWKGNQYIPASDTGNQAYKIYAGWNYKITEVNVPATFNGLLFDSTLTVTQVDEENLIDKKRSVEQFAKGVGLIYKEWILLNKQDVISPWSNPYKANGAKVFMRINSHS